jgi:hypothetical protein
VNLSFLCLFYAVNLSSRLSPTGVEGKHKEGILMEIKIMRQSRPGEPSPSTFTLVLAASTFLLFSRIVKARGLRCAKGPKFLASLGKHTWG